MISRPLLEPHDRIATRLEDDPLWFKDAIIYELRVRSYMDSNGDGIGDFAGLTSKLDYLQDLGVTALWLLPVCPSPGRDDGYDIADYTDVHPELGTIEDFKHLLDEAHRRGLRVITELVLNHTSDQHPWFQRARRARPGTPERDFYVWSESPERYKQARIIFKDFEPSNWSWDPVANAYFWHRFYSHQPDLNFHNPAVQEALLGVVDFWFKLGVDGLRLDAVPYLYEQEGTSCENLPETHAFLRKLRAHVDARFENRMLLAEANQWPEDAAAYFGSGDECHMNFHFPIMPRIFMSIHMEDRLPILDILAQTPHIPENCQWALFLRNHDELTLEMVTDEERDYMYRAFARDTAMRINLGIRRRLAPLLGNDRRNMELMNGLLLSLPGTPVLYYGDEIAMGDNIYLGDRNGVRTPMQWSADRNAGFSRANPQKLVLPVIIDPEYHFEAINVETEQQNPNSLLWWTKRIIALRKRFKAFGRGEIQFLTPENPRVLAFVRRFEEEGSTQEILVVANLSRQVQYVELNLSEFQGKVPIELFGRTRFPQIGTGPYLLSLGEHAFYWFSLEDPRARADDLREAAYTPPTIVVSGQAGPQGKEGSDGKPDFARVLQAGTSEREALEALLPAWLLGRRWYLGRERDLVATRLQQVVPLADERPAAARLYLATFTAEFAHGEPEAYVVPLAIAEGERAAEVRALGAPSPAIIAVLRGPDGRDGRDAGEAEAVLFDPLLDPAGAVSLFEHMRRGDATRTRDCTVAASLLGPPPPSAVGPAPLEPRAIREAHKHAAWSFGDRYVLKFFRSLGEGVTPELEIARYLAARPPELVAKYPAPVAPVVSALECRIGRGEPVTVSTLVAFVHGEGSAKSFFRQSLRRFLERALTAPREGRPLATESSRTLLDRAFDEPPAALAELLAADLGGARLLGHRTAELHLALSMGTDDPAFAPEPFSPLDQRSLYQSRRNLAGKVLRTLHLRMSSLVPEHAALARRLVDGSQAVYKRFEPLLEGRLSAARTRVHGHYHLQTVLYTGKDFVVLDFDGDPTRRLPERRRKRSPLTDVASMLRSFEQLAHSTLRDESAVRLSDRPLAETAVRLWLDFVQASFLRAWIDTTQKAQAELSAMTPAAPHAEVPSLAPRDRGELSLLLDAMLLQHALEEIARELDRDPLRAEIALRALLTELRLGPG